MKRQKTLKQRLMAQFYRKNHLSAAVALGISIPLGMMNLFLSDPPILTKTTRFHRI